MNVRYISSKETCMDPLEKDWEIFIAIADEQNITKAANQLYMSQPALSYRLTQLEKSFSEPLFIRKAKGVILTETGELYYSYAKDMLARKREFDESLENRKSVVAGTLLIRSSAIFANYELPTILEGFTKLYPHVKLHLQTGISSHIRHLFANNEIHIGIIRGSHYPIGEHILIRTEPICLVMPKAYDRKSIQQLPQIRYATDHDLYNLLDTWWKENYSTPPNDFIHLDTMDTCRRFIQKGLGWSILPTTGLSRYAESLTIEPLYRKTGDPILRKTGLYYHSHDLHRKPVHAFIEYMKEYIEKHVEVIPHYKS